MVQTQAPYLDCNFSNRTGELSLYKKELRTNSNSQVQIKQNVIKNRCKSQGLKLQPLTLPKTLERKIPHFTEKVNLDSSGSSIQGLHGVRKTAPSKIPVLQKYPTKTQNNDNYIFDSTLSAADKRQKFHQSRQYIAPTIKGCSRTLVKEQQNKTAFCNELLPLYNTHHLPNINFPTPSVCSKFILPPIKSMNRALQDDRCKGQGQKKCLMGEITHFPKLCNISTKPVRNLVISGIPHLPAIFFPPVPPNTISTSFECESSRH